MKSSQTDEITDGQKDRQPTTVDQKSSRHLNLRLR